MHTIAKRASSLIICFTLFLSSIAWAQQSANVLYNQKYGFTASYPSGWTILDDYGGTAIMFLESESNANVNVVAEDVPVTSLSEYVELNVNHLTNDGFKVASREDIDAYRVRVVYQYQADNRELMIATDYYVVSQRGFHVTGTWAVGDPESVVDSINQVMSSFVVTETQ